MGECSIYHSILCYDDDRNVLERIKNALKIYPETINNVYDYEFNRQWGFYKITALFLSIYNNYTDVCELLLQCKHLNINTLTEDGNTALIIALEEENYECCKLILQHPSIDLEIRDNEGHTALQIAYLYFDQEFVELLVENHAKRDGWKWINDGDGIGYDPQAVQKQKIMKKWRSYYPEWSPNTHPIYPQEFGKVVVFYLWLFKQFDVMKDMQKLLIKHIARNWRKKLDE